MKQASREWYEHLDKFLTGKKCEKSTTDPNFYLLQRCKTFVFLIVNACGITIMENAESVVYVFSKLLQNNYDIRVSSKSDKLLGIIVKDSDDRLELHSKPMIERVSEICGMESLEQWRPHFRLDLI